jgi:uncharacterized protein (TIGR03437 family)
MSGTNRNRVNPVRMGNWSDGWAVFLRIVVSMLLASPCAAQLLLANAANFSTGNFAPGSLLYIAVIGSSDLSQATVTISPSTTLPVLGVLSTGLGIVRLPPDLPLGTTSVYATVKGIDTAAASFTVISSNFGIFTQPSTAGIAVFVSGIYTVESIIPGNATRFVFRNDGSVVGLAQPAHPGDDLTVYGTGLGLATPDQVSVAIAGMPVQVTYAGPAGGGAGLDQINFHIPSNFTAADSCADAFGVTVAGTLVAPKAFSYTQSAAACPSSYGFNVSELAALDAGSQAPFVQLNLQSSIRPATEADNVGVGFTRSEFALAFERTAFSPTLLNTVDSSFYSCQLQPAGLLGAELSQAYSGFSLTLGSVSMPVGPSLISPALPTAVPTPSMLPAGLYRQGTWQLAAADFSQPLPLPAPIQLKNFAALQSIDRTKDLTITWDPTGYSPTDVLTLSLAAPLNSWFISSNSLCNARASDGFLTVPTAQLQAIPKAVTLTVGVAPHPDRNFSFRLPQTDGSTLPLQVLYSFSETFPVTLH